LAAVSHNTSFNLYLLGCGRIKPQTNIRKPGNAQLRSPHKPHLEREAAKHHTAQDIFLFHSRPQLSLLGVKATCFSLRCSKSAYQLQDPSEKPVCAMKLLDMQLETRRGSLLSPAWPGSQQHLLLVVDKPHKAAQKPGCSQDKKLKYFFFFCSNGEGTKRKDLDRLAGGGFASNTS